MVWRGKLIRFTYRFTSILFPIAHPSHHETKRERESEEEKAALSPITCYKFEFHLSSHPTDLMNSAEYCEILNLEHSMYNVHCTLYIVQHGYRNRGACWMFYILLFVTWIHLYMSILYILHVFKFNYVQGTCTKLIFVVIWKANSLLLSSFFLFHSYFAPFHYYMLEDHPDPMPLRESKLCADPRYLLSSALIPNWS